VKDYISSFDPSLIASQCISTGDPFYCGLFHRDPRSGAIFGSNAAGGYLVATTLNTGYLKTDGIDFNADYTRSLGRFGKLNVNVMGTLLLSQDRSPCPVWAAMTARAITATPVASPIPAGAMWRASPGRLRAIAARCRCPGATMPGPPCPACRPTTR
jgi:hypothetical protein